jgi:hypothetical protein
VREENPFRDWLTRDVYGGYWVPIGQLGGFLGPAACPALVRGPKETVLASTEWPIQFNAAEPSVWQSWRDGEPTREAHLHRRARRGQLQAVDRELDPDPDDHVFTVERNLFIGNRRVVKQRDPKRPASTKSLWEMVQRVCRRAGVRPFGPHALRHGFATRFLRESERDVVSLQRLLGHSKIEMTLMYVDELRVEELAEVLERIAERRVTSVADLDNDQRAVTTTRRNRRDGPGRSRTSARGFQVRGPTSRFAGESGRK